MAARTTPGSRPPRRSRWQTIGPSRKAFRQGVPIAELPGNIRPPPSWGRTTNGRSIFDARQDTNSRTLRPLLRPAVQHTCGLDHERANPSGLPRRQRPAPQRTRPSSPTTRQPPSASPPRSAGDKWRPPRWVSTQPSGSVRKLAVLGPSSRTSVPTTPTHSAQLSSASGSSCAVHHGVPSGQVTRFMGGWPTTPASRRWRPTSHLAGVVRQHGPPAAVLPDYGGRARRSRQ